ncbi:hypothetical protein V3C99_007276, partial [Haemonchus contortus]
MTQDILSTGYQVYYIVIPTISLIGNSAIVYVTVRSRSLRSPCNILIGLESLGELFHMLSHYVMVASHNVIENHLMRQDLCGYWQMFPIMGLCFASILLLSIAFDRLISTQTFYSSLIKAHYFLYISAHIGPLVAAVVTMEAMVFSTNERDLYVLCSVTAPMSDKSRTTMFLVLFPIFILVLVCYLLLVILLKKTRLSQDSSKQIYKSVAVISVTMVLGYFSAATITVFDIIFDLNV